MLQTTNAGHCRFLNSKDPSSPSVEKVGGVIVTKMNCLCAETVFGTLQASHAILTTVLCRCYNYSHCIDEETEAQRGELS